MDQLEQSSASPIRSKSSGASHLINLSRSEGGQCNDMN
jgi:hypothetical protein